LSRIALTRIAFTRITLTGIALTGIALTGFLPRVSLTGIALSWIALAGFLAGILSGLSPGSQIVTHLVSFQLMEVGTACQLKRQLRGVCFVPRCLKWPIKGTACSSAR
jgi:hypothetical protein